MANYLGKTPDAKGEGRQIVLYGPPFSGKTTTLADKEMKVFIIDMDHNTSPLDDADNVTIYPVDTFEEYEKIKNGFHAGHITIAGTKYDLTSYDIVSLDSFTRFEELVKEHVATKFAPNRSREIKGKFGAQSDWDDLQRIEVQEVRDWQTMTRSHGFNVIWLGHDMAFHDDLTKQIARIQLALQGKYASARIMSAVDAVMYLHKSIDKEGNVQRVMWTQQQGVVQAEVRLSVEKRAQLPTKLPLDKFSWSKVLPYLGYRKGVTAK